MTGARFVRFLDAAGGVHVGRVDPGAPARVLRLREPDVLAALAGGGTPSGESVEAVDPETLELRAPSKLLAPVDAPEVWAAGVTYERSRAARVEESRIKDVYGLVYAAERPELFLKDAAGRRTVGPGAAVGVRGDSRWTVPEPELALVLGEGGELLGATIGNDVTARDVERVNPLCLPQAKLFAGACALGPAVVVPADWSEPFEIGCTVRDETGAVVWTGATSTARMRRSFTELAAWLVRDNPVPAGSVLLTGTGLVPPDEVSLAPGYAVEVAVAGIGRLVNVVAAAADLIAFAQSSEWKREAPPSASRTEPVM